MAGSKRRKQGEEYIDVPFIDADEDDGEIPLAKLDEFYVPGRDDKGGQASITVNIPPALDRQLDVLISSHRFPYATKRDLVRHGILRHCSWLLGIRQKIPKHHMSMAESIIELCRDDEMTLKLEMVFLLLEDRIAAHMEKGDHQEVTRLVSIVNQRLRDLNPSAWKARFSERFYRKYNGYLTVHV